ncbi:hypothetical protein [Streptomyces sp. NBC_00055]|uniref:hypothetical protein n=1 Tax=Streptomyces sp. NBC_00055 TaxID=2975632 RepID=UPI003249E01C
MDHEVTAFDLVNRDAFSVERMSGTEANIVIRGDHDNTWEYYGYEVPDPAWKPLRIVALRGQRSVRRVFVQSVTGSQVLPGDWLEGNAPEPPRPKRQPVKVGDRVAAMNDGYTLGAGLVTSVEWKQHPMQPPYDKPPLWTWEWHVEIWFGGTETREGAWRSAWVGKASSSTDKTQENFEPVWQKLEAEFAERQAAE